MVNTWWSKEISWKNYVKSKWPYISLKIIILEVVTCLIKKKISQGPLLNAYSILKHKKERTTKQCLTQYYKESFIDYIIKIKEKSLFLGMCDSQLEFLKILLQFVKQQQQRKGTHRNKTTTTFSKLCSAPGAYILTVKNISKNFLGPSWKTLWIRQNVSLNPYSYIFSK